MKFADTGGWFALFVPEDVNHAAALAWFARQRQPLLTTDYVVDETLTLLRSRGQADVALNLGRQFFSGSLATVYYLTEETSGLPGRFSPATPTRSGASPTAPAKSSWRRWVSPRRSPSTTTSASSAA